MLSEAWGWPRDSFRALWQALSPHVRYTPAGWCALYLGTYSVPCSLLKPVPSLSDPQGDLRAFLKKKERKTGSSPGMSECPGNAGCFYSFPAAFPEFQNSLRTHWVLSISLCSRSLDSVPGKRSCLVHPGKSKWRMGPWYPPYLRCPFSRAVGRNLKHLLIPCPLGAKAFHSGRWGWGSLDICRILELMCASSAQIK